MSKRSQIKFGKFIMAIEKCADKYFKKCNIIPKSGSARRIELFEEEDDEVPCKMWVVSPRK